MWMVLNQVVWLGSSGVHLSLSLDTTFPSFCNQRLSSVTTFKLPAECSQTLHLQMFNDQSLKNRCVLPKQGSVATAFFLHSLGCGHSEHLKICEHYKAPVEPSSIASTQAVMWFLVGKRIFQNASNPDDIFSVFSYHYLLVAQYFTMEVRLLVTGCHF